VKQKEEQDGGVNYGEMYTAMRRRLNKNKQTLQIISQNNNSCVKTCKAICKIL
jgi:hypothetical protein